MELLLCLPLIIHLLIDKTGVVKHSLNVWIVVILSIIIGFFTPGYFWQGAILALSIHFCFFDYLYNLVHSHSFFYYGDPKNPNRAKIDKLREEFVSPPVEIFIRLWVLGVGAGVYFYLDKIISYI